MDDVLQERLEKLLKAFSHQYDMERDVAVADLLFPAKATFFLRDENYLLSKKHVLSAVENHGHVYFYLTERLDCATLQRLIDQTREAGLALVRPHREHMSTFVALVVLAGHIDPEAKNLLRRTHYRKNYKLAFHGWMEYQTAANEIATNRFLSNPAGRGLKKTLEDNFKTKTKKERRRHE